MKILIYDVDCKSSGVEYPIKVAFESIGHNADMFDRSKYLFTYSKVSLKNRIKNRVLEPIIAYSINKDIKEIIRSKKYDLFLVLRGDYLYPETIDFAKRFINKVVNWNTDDVFNKLNCSSKIRNSFNKYDIHFSPREHLKSDYLSLGAKSFEVLHWYYRLGLLYNQPSIGNYKYNRESSFIGSWSPRRQDLLSSLVDQKLDVFGWGWNKKTPIEDYSNWSFNPNVSIIEMTETFSKTKININILTNENRDSTNLRNYEIPAAGGFQLSERSDAVLDIFKEDLEIVCFGSREELQSKYEFYLKNESLREKIAIAGYEKLTRNNNSLVDRVKKIVEVVSK